MELLLINHPLDCPVCDKGGECPLQNQAMSNGRTESRFVDVKRTYPKPLPISSQVLLDRERCVLCARCTRFSAAGGRRPVHRAVRARRAGAGRRLRGRAVRVLLLRQHHPDLPGGRADQRPVPVPRASVRPAQRAQRLRALRVGLLDAHRLPARQGHPPAGRRGPRGQRGVDLRQGPLRVPLRQRQRPAHHAAGPPGRRAAARLLAGGLGGRGRGPARRPRGRRGRRAARRPADRRGRLRLRQVRPAGAGHQRRRRPRPRALRRGAGLPRRGGGRHRPLHRGGDLRRPRPRPPPCCSSGSSPRRSRRSSSSGCAARSARRGTQVYDLAPFATRATEKLSAHGAHHAARR